MNVGLMLKVGDKEGVTVGLPPWRPQVRMAVEVLPMELMDRTSTKLSPAKMGPTLS